MNTLRVLLAAALLSAGAPHLPAAADGGAALHPSILIESDAAFALPGSGVRGGSGTHEDPYRISGWTIVPTRGFGLLLKHTRSHVLVEDLLFAPLLAPWDVECALALPEACPEGGPRALGLTNATNVTIRRVTVPTPPAYGLRIERSAHVVVEGLVVGDPERAPPSLDATVRTALNVRDSAHVTVSGLAAWYVRYPVWVGYSEAVAIEDALLVGRRLAPSDALDGSGDVPDDAFVKLGSLDGFTLERGDLREAEIVVVGDVADLQIRDSQVRGGLFGLWNDGARLDRLLLCGSSFAGFRAAAVRVHGERDARIVGNVFTESFVGITLNGTGSLDFSGNKIADTRGWYGGGFSHPGAVARGNAFERNPGGMSVVRAADFTDNWWGSVDGPGAEGADELRATAPVAFSPWLTAPPAPGACPTP